MMEKALPHVAGPAGPAQGQLRVQSHTAQNKTQEANGAACQGAGARQIQHTKITARGNKDVKQYQFCQARTSYMKWVNPDMVPREKKGCLERMD